MTLNVTRPTLASPGRAATPAGGESHRPGFAYRAALALAEAIIPGTPAIPAADEATVARADEVVRDFHPRLAGLWRGAQAALSAAAIARTGRPFGTLSAARQQELIASWEADPMLRTPLALVGLVYKFVHFDRRPVYEAMGGRLNVVTALESPRWLRQVQRAAECAEETLECDVVVVGTGAGGAVVGRELADRGFAVVFVEEGEHHRRDAFDGSSVRAHQRFYRGGFSVGNAPIPIFMGRLVGGSTAVNGGTCLRPPPWVLDRFCEETDCNDFSPSEMERYFARVESVLEVAPSDRRVVGPIADLMARGCDTLGWSHFPIPRNAPGCNGGGFCDFGCRTDARRSTNISYVPAALDKGSLLLTGFRADGVILDSGRATGIEGVASNGKRLRIRGRAVVLSGGTIPTPTLLLSQGICNRSDQVGRNLTLHPSSGFSAFFEEDVRGHAHVPQGYACDQFLREGFLITAAQPDHNIAAAVLPFVGEPLMEVLGRINRLAHFAILVRDSGRTGRVWRDVGGFPAITYNVARDDVARMHQGMIRTAEMCLAAGATRFQPAALKMKTFDGSRGLDAFRGVRFTAQDFTWTSYHPLGTCRMGRDPKTSVVDDRHQTHDVPGLYIVDGSTVPGPLGVNPQVTIMAMATRAAEKIAEAL